MKLAQRINQLYDKSLRFASYCWKGVWRDPSSSMKVRIIKTVNLCVRTFMDTDLQIRASSLVYSTLLAIVPAFALLLAIGRGFNLQNLLTQEIFRFFPSQGNAVQAALGFVDNYLKQASQGVFVGIGIVFLLWTLISLLSDIEKAFDKLWGIKVGRSFYRKITDYTAILLLIPVMMVCSGGINVFMATAMDTVFGHTLLSPVVNIVLDCAPFLLSCLAFALSFLIVPNTHVRIKYALISGFICGIAFQLVQTLFINGQIYVAKYNAIYGSFAFLPLLLIWLQISWLIVLFGCALTYSMQNVFHLNFTEDSEDTSPDYRRKITIVVAAIIATRFKKGEKPITLDEMSVQYGLPIRMITRVAQVLKACDIIYYVVVKGDIYALAPAVDLSTFTLGDLIEKVDAYGETDYVYGLEKRYSAVVEVVDRINQADIKAASNILLADLVAE